MSSNENDTDYKLAELTKLLPEADIELLLEVLVSCNGDLKSAREILDIPLSGVSDTPYIDPVSTSRSIPVESPSSKIRTQVTLKRFLDIDEADASFDIKKERLMEKGKPIHIYDPSDVEKLLPCTMHLNVFPKELANNILEYLMEESEEWPKNIFYLFDRKVSSPHKTAFYTDNQEIFDKKSATYNGNRVKNPLLFNADMSAAKVIVQNIVNREIKKRGLLPYQHPHKWKTDVAICNRYDGPKSSVGFHSDQLTHLGPHCVIASISLGVTREFRLKNRINTNARPISVHLPHNSLIIMHAGCQEEYKHSIMPSNSRPLDPHPISGGTRINITYRMYLEKFKEQNLPRCECNKTMILRVATNAKNTVQNSSKLPVYIWLCGSSYSNGKECGKSIMPTFAINKSDSFDYSSDDEGDELLEGKNALAGDS